jgi:lipoprotein-anchoring transpeptidase ErfK/SrfK
MGDDAVDSGARLTATTPDLTKLPWLTTTPPPSSAAGELIETARTALEDNNLVAARTNFAQALNAGLPPAQADEVRAELTELAEETIFNPAMLEGDPLTDAYVIKSGDSLAKIAKEHRVTADLLAQINNIKDPARIRAGWRIKVIHGPFHGVVSKSGFSLDLYLQDTFVRQYKVGLGTDGSTPTGDWLCKDKLVNPKFYPPRGGKIIPGGHPENPLGTRWVGLKGVGGEAVGQFRYGLHGTIDPSSIGKNVSMGCIRMHNEDVEVVYTLLIDKHSHVVVVN